jgi:hypothetical protein
LYKAVLFQPEGAKNLTSHRKRRAVTTLSASFPLVWSEQIYIAKSHGEFVESDDRGITVTSLKATDVLLAKARNLGKLLLSQAPPLSDSPNIPTDQSAHVHAQRSADYTLEV